MPRRATDGGTYRGLLGAFRYSFGASDSWLFRAYVAVAGFAGLFVTLIFAFGVVTLLAATSSAAGGVFTLSRSFYLVVLVLVLVPLFAPVLLVARRHRRAGSTARYDRALALAGFLFLLSLYLAALVSAPPAQREAPPAAVAPVVEFLYALPPLAGLVPPVAAAALVYVAHRAFGAKPGKDGDA
ncbi:MAG: hypothetical protein ABEJ04_01940 [Halobacteriaceae archaeon]